MKIFRCTFFLALIIFFKPVSAQQAVKENIDAVFYNTSQILQAIHYQPQVWNDSFSSRIYNSYFETLDPDKKIFIKEDIETLKPFQYLLDDEFKAGKPQFFKSINLLYKTRIEKAQALIEEILIDSFNYKTPSYFNNNDEKNFAENYSELKDKWKSYLKFSTLSQLDLLLMQNANDSIAIDTSALQKKARETVLTTQKRIISNILKQTTEEEALNSYINHVFNLYDPHSSYLLPEDKRSFKENMSGIYYGIGALLKEQQGKVKIAELMIGGPAWKSGMVNKEDVIIKVAQQNEKEVNVEGMMMSEIIKLTRGEKGTEVTITFRRVDGTVKAVTMLRDELQLDDSFIKTAVIGDKHKTGYIYFPKFYTSFGDENARRCSEDMASAIESLKKEKVEGIIVDIRNNGGGSLGEVIQMLGLFITEGPVVQIKSSGAPVESGYVKSSSALYKGPVIVLVNELSASASEIFAGAIQDYNRGIIMGASTFGKGTVQRSINVPQSLQNVNSADGQLGSIHITLQKYYRVTGEATQIKGVIPDIALPGVYQSYKLREINKPTALKWDTIAPLPFKKIQDNRIAKTISKMEKMLLKDSSLIQLNEYLNCNTSKPDAYLLTLESYRNEKQKQQYCNDNVFRIYRSEQKLKVTNTADVAAVMLQKEDFRKENNKYFLNNLSNDLYLSKAVEAMQIYTGRKLF